MISRRETVAFDSDKLTSSFCINCFEISQPQHFSVSAVFKRQDSNSGLHSSRRCPTFPGSSADQIACYSTRRSLALSPPTAAMEAVRFRWGSTDRGAAVSVGPWVAVWSRTLSTGLCLTCKVIKDVCAELLRFKDYYHCIDVLFKYNCLCLFSKRIIFSILIRLGEDEPLGSTHWFVETLSLLRIWTFCFLHMLPIFLPAYNLSHILFYWAEIILLILYFSEQKFKSFI